MMKYNYPTKENIEETGRGRSMKAEESDEPEQFIGLSQVMWSPSNTK